MHTEGLQRPEEGVRVPGAGVVDVLRHPAWVLGTEPCLLLEQQELLMAKSSLAPGSDFHAVLLAY